MSRVLLVAPTVDGEDVGEAWVAHQWAAHLSALHDVTLLTYRKRGAQSAREQLPQTRVVEWEEPPSPIRAERLNSLLKPGYFPYALRAHRWIRRAIRQGERFDIAHQPLPVAMRYPTPLLNIPIPYVIGPVGGSLQSPAAFDAEDTAPWYVGLRKLDATRVRLDPLLRATFIQAACVLGIAPYVGDFLAAIPTKRIEYMSETGLVSLPKEVVRDHRPATPVRLLYVGRVIRTKGVRDLIAAIPLTTDTQVVVDIVGDGFDLDSCKLLAAELGIADKVQFHGRLERSAIDSLYASCDVFVFPSFREPGGNVVFEAMAHSLPLIVCDTGGPMAATDESCAIRVSAKSPTQLARDLADAITILAKNRALRLQMGEAARIRVAEVGLWSSKIEKISALYEDLIKDSNNTA